MMLGAPCWSYAWNSTETTVHWCPEPVSKSSSSMFVCQLLRLAWVSLLWPWIQERPALFFNPLQKLMPSMSWMFLLAIPCKNAIGWRLETLHILIKAKATLPPEHVPTNPFTENLQHTYTSVEVWNPVKSFPGDFFSFTVLLFLSSTKYSKARRIWRA